MIEIPELCTQLKSLVRKGHYQQALSLFHLHHKHHPVTHETLTHILPSLIKSSSSSNHHLIPLQVLHSISLKTCAISDLFVSNSLISAYSKRLGGLHSARRVFDEMPERDTVTWNSIIMGFIQNAMFDQALRFFSKMRVATEGLSPIKPEVIASVLSVCSKMGRLRQGKEIHGLVVIDGEFFAEEPSVILVETALVDLYVKCGELGMGFRVFDRMRVKNEVSWTAMINGCTANGAYEMALDCVRNFMDDHDGPWIRPNRVTLISVMPACAELGLIKQGKEIHGFGLRHGFDGEPRFSAGLIAMYCSFKGGGRKGASSSPTRIAGIILDRSHERDVVMWTTVIGNFAQDGRLDQAMKHLNRMRSEGIEANYVTLLALISGCANQVSLTDGRAIHCHALKSSLCSDPYVGNALIDMYAKCGLAQDSSRTFADLPEKDSISWSALINAYGINGQGHRALGAFYEMKEEGVVVDGIALLSTLSACNHSGLVEQAQSIFKEAVEEVAGGKRKWLGVEHYACMIDLLGKAGMIEEAYGVMKSMPAAAARFNKPNVKIWSSLFSKCKEHGKLDIAEALIREKKKVVEMEEEPGSAANYASSSVVYAERGEWVNAEEVRRGEGLSTRRGFSKVEVQNG